MATVRELILAASTLPAGAKHREHLDNLNAGGGGGTTVVNQIEGLSVALQEEEVYEVKLVNDEIDVTLSKKQVPPNP